MHDEVLFAADAVFPKSVLDKYRIPFYTDIDAARDSFAKILALQPEVVVPGHGPICRGSAIAELIATNAASLEELRQRTWELIAQPRSTAEILGAIMDGCGLVLNAVGQYCLAFTTIQAACSSLVEAGEAEAAFHDNTLRWRRS
jgi:glyoxylase-like metal-dependent hydrolase (beta-lactamase superfamily II)